MRNRIFVVWIFVFFLFLGGVVQTLAQSNPADRAVPTWNNSGRIYFKTGQKGEGEVYSVKADGTDLKPFITVPGENYSPRWSHDGKHGALMSERDGDYEIYSINADGTNEKRLTFNKGNDWDPSWSPDGKWI
ncbi:MAG: hypothetical protein ABI646_06215 [Acidobacteriota bacterium]